MNRSKTRTDAHRAADRRYRERHKDAIRESQRERRKREKVAGIRRVLTPEQRERERERKRARYSQARARQKELALAAQASMAPIDPATPRHCGTCQELKTVADFGRDVSQKDGLNHRCRQCAADQRRGYREAHPDKNREACRRYYLANKQKVIAAVTRWKQAQREKSRIERDKYHSEKYDAGQNGTDTSGSRT